MARSSDDDHLPSYWDSVKILSRELVHQYGVSETSALGPELLWNRPDIVAIFPPRYDDRGNSRQSSRPASATVQDQSSRPKSSDADPQPRTDVVHKPTPQTAVASRVTPSAPLTSDEEIHQSDVPFTDFSPIQSTYIDEVRHVHCNNPSLPHSSTGCVCVTSLPKPTQPIRTHSSQI